MILKNAIENAIIKVIHVIFKQYKNFINYENMAELKFKSDILKSSNKYPFYKFLYIFFIYIKMSKNLSAKYYHENKDYKKSLQKI